MQQNKHRQQMRRERQKNEKERKGERSSAVTQKAGGTHNFNHISHEVWTPRHDDITGLARGETKEKLEANTNYCREGHKPREDVILVPESKYY